MHSSLNNVSNFKFVFGVNQMVSECSASSKGLPRRCRYLAGLADGSACFVLHHQAAHGTSMAIRVCHSASHPYIELLQSRFGGRIETDRRRTSHRLIWNSSSDLQRGLAVISHHLQIQKQKLAVLQHFVFVHTAQQIADPSQLQHSGKRSPLRTRDIPWLNSFTGQVLHQTQKPAGEGWRWLTANEWDKLLLEGMDIRPGSK